MLERERLQRDEVEDKQGLDAPALEPSRAAGADVPDLPALGGSGAGMTGGLDAAIAAQEAELARVRSLPPGHPELEAHKSPEALAASVPAGPGATGAAEADAASKSAVDLPAPAASFGALASSPAPEPGGAGLSVPTVEVPGAPPSVGAVDAAVSAANAGPAAVESVPEIAAPSLPTVDAAIPAPAPVSAPADVAAPSAAEVAAAPAEVVTAAPVSDAASAPTLDQGALDGGAPQGETPPAANLEGVDVAAPDAATAQVDDAPALAEPEVVDAPANLTESVAGPAAAEPAAAPPPVEVQATSAPPSAAGAEVLAPEQVPQTTVSDAPAAEPAVAEAAASPPAPAPATDVSTVGEAAAASEVAPSTPAPTELASAAPDVAATSGAGAALSEAVADALPAAPAVANPVVETASAVVLEAAARPDAALADVQVPDAAGLIDSAGATLASAQEGLDVAVADVTAGAGAAAETLGQRGADALTGAATPDLVGPLRIEGAAGDLLAGQRAATELGLPTFGDAASAAREAADHTPSLGDPVAEALVAGVREAAAFDPAEARSGVEAVAEDARASADAAATAIGAQVEALGAEAQQAAGALGGLEEGERKLRQTTELLQAADKEPLSPQAVMARGKPLDGAIKQRAERALGASLGDVKVFEGAGVQQAAERLGATAFAEGGDVFLGSAANLGGQARDKVLAEELAHVVQMRQAPAGDRAGTSRVEDQAEKRAVDAAQRIVDGASRVSLGIDRDRRALYRNAATPAAEQERASQAPSSVDVDLAGQRRAVSVPELEPGTSQKTVTLPSMNVPGLTLDQRALFRFDPDTGAFQGGTARGTIAVGGALHLEGAQIRIDQSGQMESSMRGVRLTAGALIDTTVNASIGPQGVSASGRVSYSEIMNDAYGRWLTSGGLEVRVDPQGHVSGSGVMGFSAGPFNEGSLLAQLDGDQLTGRVHIQQTDALPLGSHAALVQGNLTGQMGTDGEVSLSGQVDVEAPTLGSGRMTAQWSSAEDGFGGNARLEVSEGSRFGESVLASGQMSGQLESGALTRVEGAGQGKVAEVFEGRFSGSVDLPNATSSLHIAGGLARPITQGEVTVSGGNLTARVEDGALTSAAGGVDFELGGFLRGSAVLEAGTNADTIHATATAGLVSPLTVGDVTMSQGAATVRVRGTESEIIGGHVDLAFKDIATGSLALSASPSVRELSGHAQARIAPGTTFGELTVHKGAIGIDIERNNVQAAQGNAEVDFAQVARGVLGFDALGSLHALDGTATAWLTAPVALGDVTLLADDQTRFDTRFVGGSFASFKGNLAYEAGPFAGRVTVAQETTDLYAPTGKGVADLREPLTIAEVGGQALQAVTGSTLAATLEEGRFGGVTGTLAWRYGGWLGGRFQITEPAETIDTIDGEMDAEVLQAAPLPGNADVVVQPSEGQGALRVRIQDGQPTHYRGQLGFLYKGLLQGAVGVEGELLDFSTLQGRASATVVERAALPGDFALLPGGALDVTFEGSRFDAFAGTARFGYQDWLEGTLSAEANAGSSMSAGLSGKATATLSDVPTSMRGRPFRLEAGGTAHVALAAGTGVTTVGAGSQLAWGYEDWLRGDVQVTADTALSAVSGQASASVTTENRLLDNPAVTMLPASGLSVELTGGQVAGFSGDVALRVSDWLEGTLAVEGQSTPERFSGALRGGIVAQHRVEGTTLTLDQGGAVEVRVDGNRPTTIAGTVPFREGDAGVEWLAGKVEVQAPDVLAGIDGAVTARVIADKALSGGLTLREGGHIATTMSASHIATIAGQARWDLQGPAGGEPWLGGAIELAEGSTPNLVSGTFDAAVLSDRDAGAGVTLVAGGAVRGSVTSNALGGIAGEVALRYGQPGTEAWLGGTLSIGAEAAVEQLSGELTAGVLPGREYAVVPDRLYLTEGGSFTAAMNQGQVGPLTGTLAWRFEDWIAGRIDVAATAPEQLAGRAQASVVGAGKVFGAGSRAVKLLPGGSLEAEVSTDGVQTITGSVAVEYGQPSDGSALHLRGTATAQDARPSSFSGRVEGALRSPYKLPPTLTLQPGGSLGVDIDAGAVRGLSGDVGYRFAPGGEDFVAGQLSVDAGSTAESVSGVARGSLLRELRLGDALRVLPGGALEGRITGTTELQVGGQLEARYEDWLAGTVDIIGTVDPAGGRVDGALHGKLLSDKVLPGADGITITAGSSLSATVEGSQVRSVYGTVSVQVGADLAGTIAVPQGSAATFDQLSGAATLELLADRPVGATALTVQAGSMLGFDVQAGRLSGAHGQVRWRYEDWLAGDVEVAAGGDGLNTLSGEATGRVLRPHPVGGGLELMKGGSAALTLGSGGINEVGGTLRFRYGQGAPWLQGAVTLAGRQPLSALSGQASAKLIDDLEVGPGPTRLSKYGSNLQAELQGNAVTSFSGDAELRYGDNRWLHGTLSLAPGSTPDAVHGDASLRVNMPYAVPGTDATLRKGGALRGAFDATGLQSFDGQVPFTWGQDDFVGGRLTVEAGSTPERVRGSAEVSLRRSRDIPGTSLRAMRGGSLQGTFDGTRLTGLTGAVRLVHDGWLDAELQLEGAPDLERFSGTATATLRQHKQLGGGLTVTRGGSLSATVQDNSFTGLSGQAGWRYEDWLQGSVTLQDATLDRLSGEATATLTQPRQLTGDLALDAGGALTLGLDSSANVTEQRVSGQAAFKQGDWLGGQVALQDGSTLSSISGSATARLLTEKSVGGTPLVLEPGGAAEVTLSSSAPTSLSGTLGWRFEDWLGGSVQVSEGSSFERISGQATASLRAEKSLTGSPLVLEQGGAAQVTLRDGAPAEVSGQLGWRYEDWLGGRVDVDAGASFDSIQGQADARLRQDRPIGGGDLQLRAGSGVAMRLEGGRPGPATGTLAWTWQDWLQGSAEVQASSLDTLSGEATATLQTEKQIGGEVTLEPGGHASVTMASGQPTALRGDVRARVGEDLRGRLTIESGDLERVSGSADLRLLQDWRTGADFAVLKGSGVQAQIGDGQLQHASGRVRFSYADWLAGSITLQEATPQTISGDADARLVAPHQPGGGALTLQPGGHLKLSVDSGTPGQFAGDVRFTTDGPVATKGRVTVAPSSLDALTGTAQASLLADTAPMGGTRLLAGGALELEVAQSELQSFGGRVRWQHEDWLQGHAEVASGSAFDGPIRGEAQATLLADKPLGGKAVALAGGVVRLQLDTAASLDAQQVEGHLGLRYDEWLEGHAQVATSPLNAPTGTANLATTAERDLGGGLVLEEGSALQTTLTSGDISGAAGTVRIRFDDWLGGGLQLAAGSTLDSMAGDAHVEVRAEKSLGKLTVREGGALHTTIEGGTLGTFDGHAAVGWDGWAEGALQVDEGSRLDAVSGQAQARVVADQPVSDKITLREGGSAELRLQSNEVTELGGALNVRYEDWAEGALTVSGLQQPRQLSGDAQVSITRDKPVGSTPMTVKQGSGAQVGIEAGQARRLSGHLAFGWDDWLGGNLQVEGESGFEQLSGQARVALLRDKPLGAGVSLLQGGNASARFDGASFSELQGQLGVAHDEWLEGRVEAEAGSSFDSVRGEAEVAVVAERTFAQGVTFEEGSVLQTRFGPTGPSTYRGNVQMRLQDWLEGSVAFTADDLDSIAGQGELLSTTDKQLAGPVSMLAGSYVRGRVEGSQLADFSGNAQVSVDGWGRGGVSVRPGSTLDNVSGEGSVTLDQPRDFGGHVTLTSATLGAAFERSEITGVYGEAQADIREFGTGWVRISKQSDLQSFWGQAGMALTQPRAIGSFAELSGGQILANFEDNALSSFGGWAEIEVFGWGRGKVSVDAGSTMEHIQGTATIALTEPKRVGNKVLITGGEVSATVSGQELTRVAGMVEAELVDIARGRVDGQLDVATQSFSGRGEMTQLRDWEAGPARVHSASLTAVIHDNRLVGATGRGQIDAGRYGKGAFDVNYEDVGGEPLFYGSGEVAFEPHDRVSGRLRIDYSRDQKLTGRGDVTVRVNDDIQGSAGVVLDDRGHVLLDGEVRVPGPMELFEPPSFQRDITLLDAGFVVYTPPTVSVNVGAGLGLEAGLRPLTLSDMAIGGTVDLMEPEFANMAVTGQISSAAYADLNVWVEGSVQVSAAVVAVQAGLNAALNMHMEAALSARPTMGVSRDGLTFDMPVDAQLSAALNLILTFFAKVRVGLDLGLFSIMKTVWQYDVSPDPLRLGSFEMNAGADVHAGPDGFRADMRPSYEPPDLSIDGLRRALKI